MFELIAENRIRQAMQDGVFDSVTSPGTPIDLDEYFSLPEDVRVGYTLLRSANCVPEQVELMRQIAQLEQEMIAAPDAAAAARTRRELEDHRLRLAILRDDAKRHR